MANESYLVTVTPQQLQLLQGLNVTPAHLAYRIGAGFHLLRAGGSGGLKGGVMVLGEHGFDETGSISAFLQEVGQECAARGFRGILADFETRTPTLETLVKELAALCRHRNLPLYVPEYYAPCACTTRVIIPSSISGGSLTLRLQEAVSRYGAGRVVLALERVAEDFTLPSPSGCGVPLSEQQLHEQMKRLCPSVFYSGELCARYYTYMSRENGAHFVMFDDGDTLRCKADTAKSHGITQLLLAFPDVETYGAQLGISRTQPQSKPSNYNRNRGC